LGLIFESLLRLVVRLEPVNDGVMNAAVNLRLDFVLLERVRK